MLDNFKNIYDEEIINGDYTTFETRILNSSSLRMFVYEVCKACATLQPLGLCRPQSDKCKNTSKLAGSISIHCSRSPV